MAECIVCKAETFVQVGTISVCINCLENQARTPPRTQQEIRGALVRKIIDATARANAANETFSALTSRFPSGLPHPDGVQRIKNASRELSLARKELMAAHRRLHEFVEGGGVPQDLNPKTPQGPR